MSFSTAMHVDVGSFDFYESFNVSSMMGGSYQFDSCPSSAASSMSTPSPPSSTGSVSSDFPVDSYCDQNQVDINLFGHFSNTGTLLDSLPPMQKVEDQPYCQKSMKRPKRKRVITGAQRKAANIRERRRMLNINDAFDELRKKVPDSAHNKGPSRIQTLKHAIVYISYLKDVLNGRHVENRELQNQSQNFELDSDETTDQNYF